jgi:hypothetical protein
LATLNRSQELLVVDMRIYECGRRLIDHEVATLDQLGYGGMVLLEDLSHRNGYEMINCAIKPIILV